MEEGEEEWHDVMEGEGNETHEEATFSIHALEGSQGDDTIRMIGHYKNRELLILINSGSTHSFLDEQVAKEMKVPIVTAPAVVVTVVDGRKIFSSNRSLGFTWKIQEHSFTLDVRLLPLGGFVMILGVDWMKLHNPVLFDFENFNISFQVHGKIVSLRGVGEGGLEVEEVNHVSGDKLFHKQGADFEQPMFCVKATFSQEVEMELVECSATTSAPDAFQQALQVLLVQYEGLFKEPQELPPLRSHNHSIPLLPNA